MNDSSLTLLLPEEPLTESPLSGLIVILYHIPVQLPPFLVKCANWKIFIFYYDHRKSYSSCRVKIQYAL